MTREGRLERAGSLTRRGLLRVAGAAAVVAGTDLGATHHAAAALSRRPGQRVAVLGGGMSGLTAAHELAERGFEVTVYERKSLGGKSRSIPVPGPGRAAGGRCRASTASGSSPASITTCRTRCAASPSRAILTVCGTPRGRRGDAAFAH